MTTEAPLRFHPARTVTVELPKDEMQIRFAPDETIYFVSSSGHCNLDCSYCVIQPVVKHQPSLNYDDLAFVLERTPGKVFFIFSGKVHWPAAAVMAVCALIGGLLGGKLAGKIKPTVLRWLVVSIGVAVGVYYLVRG